MRNADPDQLDDAGIITPWDFPYGVRCESCNEVIENGRAYWSIPDSTTRNGDVIGAIVCAGCAVTAQL
jgi:hypothetical protein